MVNKVTGKPVTIPNLKVTQLINNVPVGKSPNMKTPVQPDGREQVVLKVVVTVPHLGSNTKEIVMPVKNDSK